MTEGIIGAIITGLLALTGTVISNLATHSKTLYRIEQLEKKQDKHNNLIERTYALEKTVSILDERQRAVNDKLASLEDEFHEQKLE